MAENMKGEHGMASVKRMTRGSKEYADTIEELLRETGKPGARGDMNDRRPSGTARPDTDIYNLRGRRRD